MALFIAEVTLVFHMINSNTCLELFWSLSLIVNHIRNLWVVLAGQQQMNCTHAVRTTRSLSGTCWPVRPVWLSDCQRTFTPLTYTGSPKPLVARNRPRRRSLSWPALMASLYILHGLISEFTHQIIMSVLLFIQWTATYLGSEVVFQSYLYMEMFV